VKSTVLLVVSSHALLVSTIVSATSFSYRKYHGPLVRELMESLQTRFNGLMSNAEMLSEPQNDRFVDMVHLMASLLDLNNGSVWLEDDLPFSVTVKDAVQQ